MKIFCYILQLNNGTFYTGITNNMDRRIFEHTHGKSKSTRNFLPITVIHIEPFLTRKDARKREVEIKGRGAKRYLLKLKFSPDTQPQFTQ